MFTNLAVFLIFVFALYSFFRSEKEDLANPELKHSFKKECSNQSRENKIDLGNGVSEKNKGNVVKHEKAAPNLGVEGNRSFHKGAGCRLNRPETPLEAKLRELIAKQKADGTYREGYSLMGKRTHSGEDTEVKRSKRSSSVGFEPQKGKLYSIRSNTSTETDITNLNSPRVVSAATRKNSRTYTNHCHMCYETVSSDRHQRCKECGWFKCGSCNACKPNCR